MSTATSSTATTAATATAATSAATTATGERKKEIYTYDAPWPVFGLAWSYRKDKPFRLAVGSFIEEYTNKIRIIQLDGKTGQFNETATFDHPYPATKIKWLPDKTSSRPDLLATTGDYMRIWEVKERHDGTATTHLKSLLNSNKSSEFCAPLTSFDWNETDNSLLVSASIDTTCTVWNVETSQAKTQLIAHDREVYDVAFATRGSDIFASVGADGSMRMFDLRNLAHSTIIYESSDLTPLIRLAWNKLDPNYIAAFAMDSQKAVIVDIRIPALPVAELKAHTAPLNALSWAPHSSAHICTAADDKQAVIWDLSPMPITTVEDPILAYTAPAEVNNLDWRSVQCGAVQC